jgi:hypothetical protein
MSRYDNEDRKQIVRNIESLKNEKDYLAIFEILNEDENNSYTSNSNGIFLNISLVSDDTLDKVTKYLNKHNKKNKMEIELDIIPRYPMKSEKAYKHSTYEKNILKQRQLKKIMNDEKDYQELNLGKIKSQKRT